MKIKLKRSTVAGGKRHIVKDKPITVDVPDSDGRYLIAVGKAEKAEEKKADK